MSWHKMIESMSLLSPTERMGWALLHSLWQETAIALLLAIVLLLMRRSSASRRYAVSCAALLLMAALPIGTAALLFSVPPQLSQPSRPGHGTAVFLHPVAVAPVLPAGHATAERPILGPMLLRALSYAWLAGCAATSLWNALGWTRVQRIKRRSTAAPARWEQVLDRLAGELRVQAAVRLLVCQRVWAPAVVGWLRPIVLVPASALTELPAHQLEALLAHELAHVRRHDYLLNLIQTAIETLLFYHPAVWWVGSRIRQEREHCCDDIAAAHRGSAIEYARALAALAELRLSGTPALALSSGGGKLLERIERLIAPRRAPTPTRPLGALIVVAPLIVALSLLIRLPHAVAQSATTRSTTTAATSTASTRPVASAIRPEDLAPSRADYHISRNDLLNVTISDINGPNTETVKQARVSESGNISMPYLDQPIHAEGLTEIELERAIIGAYKVANLIARANVSVTMIEARGRVYRILGSVHQPGEYAMFEADYRLLDAIAQAKGISGVAQTVRVIRRDEHGDGERLIDIPADKLLAGDPTKLNLVVRPGDVILVSGNQAQARPANAKIVRLVVGKEMTFQSRKMSWEEIATALQNDPDHANIVLEIAPESDDVTVGQFFDAQARAGEMVKTYGLKYLSVVATRPAKAPQAGEKAGGFCYIGGHIDRPGAYQIDPAAPQTLGELIENAGIGFAAHPDEIVLLIRRTDGAEQSTELELQTLLLSKRNRSDPKLIVHAGDKLMVGANPRQKNPDQ